MTVTADPALAGFYRVAGLTEDPTGSGLYLLDTGPSAPTGNLPSGFQPFDGDEKLYYPSALQRISDGIYSTEKLTTAGDRLYSFAIGDYAYPVYAPIPHVEMTIFTLDPACVTITVYRTVKNRTMPVRGQIGVYAVGGRNVVDWEAPFGIPVSYRSEQFDADGDSLGYTTPTTTQLDVTETWIQNVFDPAGAVPVTMTGGTAGALSRPVPTDTYWASGSGVAVGISGQRRGLVDVPCSFLTFTEENGDRVRDMFGDPYVSPSVPPVLCIRIGAGMKLRFPKPFYALVAEPVETPLDAESGGDLIRWECTGTEVAPPAPALVPPLLTYADLDAAYPTYTGRDAAYRSYLEMDRDYSLAGFAATTQP